MLVPLLLVVLEATLPSYTAAPDSCYGAAVPLTDLEIHRLWWVPPQGGIPTMLRSHYVAGREGQVDTFQVTPDSMPGYYHTTTMRATGAESCPSNEMFYPILGPTTGVQIVEPIISAIRSEFWVDVHGRRVAEPSASGLYWHVQVMENGERRIRKRLVLK